MRIDHGNHDDVTDAEPSLLRNVASPQFDLFPKEAPLCAVGEAILRVAIMQDGRLKS